MAVVSSVRCEPAQENGDDAPVDNKQQASRRSIGEYHGLYAPSYHGHYAPAAATYHGNFAPHYHAGPDHYHLHADGFTPAHLHGHGYAPAAGHYHLGQEVLAHGAFRHQQPVVYQSVVNTYPTATTVVHKPVPVAVPVAQPVPVPVARPVPVEVPRPYPVAVNRPYPVAVIKPVPVPVAQPYPVPVYRPYPVPVYRPLPVAPVARPVATVSRPVAVRVPLVRYQPAQSQLSYAHSHRAVYAPVHSHRAVYAPAHSHRAVYAPAHSHVYAAPHSHGYAAPHAHVYGPTRSYAPHYHVGPTSYPAAASSYLQQLAAVRAASAAAASAVGGDDYEVNEASAEQQTLVGQDDYNSFLRDEQTDGHLHADAGHHHLHEHVVDQDQGGYPSLTADETFKTSLGVPSTDYGGKKK